jgi:hypothetical protein
VDGRNRSSAVGLQLLFLATGELLQENLGKRNGPASLGYPIDVSTAHSHGESKKLSGGNPRTFWSVTARLMRSTGKFALMRPRPNLADVTPPPLYRRVVSSR